MSYKRLSLMVIALLILLFPIYFTASNIIHGDVLYSIPFILLIAYFSHSLIFIRNEALRIKKDRLDGIQERVLVLCNYNILYKKIERNNNIPPIPLATFKYYENDEYINLSGDYSNVDMVEGKRYKVKYYKNSELLIEIEPDNSKPRKLIKHSKIPNQSNRYKQSERIENSSFLEVLITFLIGAPIFIFLFGLYELFKFIQTRVLMTKEDILLIQPVFLVWVFIIYGFCVLMLIIFERYNDYLGLVSRIYSKLGFKKIITLVSIIFTIILIQLFSTYIKISEYDIECKNGYFLESNTYSWNSVEKANVYYSSGTRNKSRYLNLHYVLELKGGNTIDLNNSEMFWDKILRVDSILKQYNLSVHRGIISYADSIELLVNANVEIESGLNTLSKIMAVEGNPTIGPSSR